MRSLAVLAALGLAVVSAPVSFGNLAHAVDDPTGLSDAPGGFSLAQYYEEPPVRGGYGTRRPPRDEDVPRPGSGRTILAPADVGASATWSGCRAYRNRFKEPFQRCCSINRRGIRTCQDVY